MTLAATLLLTAALGFFAGYGIAAFIERWHDAASRPKPETSERSAA